MEVRGDFQTFFKYVSMNVIGMIGLSVYILADTIFIANGVGESGLAALNLALPIFTLISGFGLLIGIGGATWYTILRAQNKPQSAASVFNHALALGAILSLLCMLIGFVGSDFLAGALGADVEILPMTSIYLKVIMLFAPFFVFNNMLVAFIRNDQNPKLAMAGMFVGSFANIVMDYLFIIVLDMGMLGAALATGATPFISLALLVLHFKSTKNTLVLQKIKWKLAIFWKIITLGISAFVTEISTGVVILIFNMVILRLAGNTGVAAYGIIANIAFVVIAIYTGMAQGIQPIVSHLFGSQKYSETKKMLAYGVGSALLLALIIYGVVTIGSTSIIGVFNRDHSVALAEMAETGLMIYFIGFFFAGFNIISIAYLSAIERAGLAFKLSIIRSFVLIVPIILLFAYLFNMTGVWLSFIVTEMITTAIIAKSLT
ncbi:MATE family efflux transporter [Amphibacillus cookii]|uniref:MATE family efflux transporter n=1 Tax=Amphibacillus cookii TaxID=767787 RepID=UPI0019586A7F|nr:MATE family efflux transporter [Amphibacillus cookii]MBM7542001.1 putative MATE family efflux protein [Amphibacillus cookii]